MARSFRCCELAKLASSFKDVQNKPVGTPFELNRVKLNRVIFLYSYSYSIIDQSDITNTQFPVCNFSVKMSSNWWSTDYSTKKEGLRFKCRPLTTFAILKLNIFSFSVLCSLVSNQCCNWKMSCTRWWSI